MHGLGGGWRSWSPILDELAEQREVIAVDLPGFSDTLPLGGEVSVASLTDSVVDFVGEQGLDGVSIVGQSLGGRIVLELARRGVGGDVVALDPGGFWSAIGRGEARVLPAGQVTVVRHTTRLRRPSAPTSTTRP